MTVTSDRPARSPQSASPIPADAPPPAARDRLAGSLPYLRRYARALSGTQSSGDAFVRMMLEAALSDPEMRAQVNASAVGLYKAFTAVWNTANLDAVDGRETPEPNPSQLSRVPSQRRQALLLNQLEDFSIADTADILDLSEEETQLLVDAAMADLAGDSVADVLIIEDEPLISSHLESIVAEAGHRIIANATTADEARAAFEQHRGGERRDPSVSHSQTAPGCRADRVYVATSGAWAYRRLRPDAALLSRDAELHAVAAASGLWLDA